MDINSPQFWVAVLQIIAIDIILGGDNAIVIALACRRLPKNQRNRGIFWGVFGAIALRVLLISFALTLLTIPFLKIIGSILLIWIGIKLLQPNTENKEPKIGASATLLGAIKTIIIADVVMSLDNVIAIAGAAKNSVGLVIFGLIISVPIIVWGSKLIMKLMDRFPVFIIIGAGLLGWIAGDMFTTDSIISEWVNNNASFLQWLSPVLGVSIIVLTGKFLAFKSLKNKTSISDLIKDIEKP
tara:strand:- start:10046 stop:10768 length:723 start_codon:yes stop_codon:yes gene_type:complete